MRRTMMCCFLVITTALCFAAVAQDDSKMSGPPKVLQIIREEVKVGKTATHEKFEAAWTQAMVKAKYDSPILALTTATGPSEAWFTVGYASFADWEKQNKAMDGASLTAVSQQYGP